VVERGKTHDESGAHENGEPLPVDRPGLVAL
jgi:hypothetical protein